MKLYPNFKKMWKQEKEHLHFSWGGIALVSEPDQSITRKECYRSISLMNVYAMFLYKILAKQIQWYCKG